MLLHPTAPSSLRELLEHSAMTFDESRTAFIIVDVQNDFCEGGSLAVEGGAETAERISRVVAAGHCGTVVTTQDWHIDPGSHFSQEPDFLDSWPVHCAAHTPGAQLHPRLRLPGGTPTFHKGEFSAAYSGFEGRLYQPEVPLADRPALNAFLHSRFIDTVVIAGIAYDYCVKETALSARALGYETTVVESLSAAISEQGARETRSDLIRAGVRLVR